MAKKKEQAMTGRDFEALPDSEKERIFKELDNLPPAQIKSARRLTLREERALYQPPKNKGGRPKLGKGGTRIISASLERELLKRADRYAKSHGMKRSQVLSEGLKLFLAKSA